MTEQNSPNEAKPASKPKEKMTFWQRVLDAIGYNQRYFWTGTWLLFALTILLIPIYCTKKVHIEGALLWAFAFLVAGTLLGFVFGVPTIITRGANAGQRAGITDNEERKIVQANTNLTQISDWLTKVIVGAGLVELREIPPFIVSYSVKMGKGLAISPADLNYANV